MTQINVSGNAGSCVSTLRHEASVSNKRTPPTPVVADGDRSNGKRPGLPIIIFNKQFNALLDSGAAISAISEETFASIKRNIPRGECLSILPVTGVTISTAVRGRSRRVTAQVLIPFSVSGHTIDCICLVVPHLATSIILGDDWLTQNRVRLDYATRVSSFPSWGLDVPFSASQEESVNPINAFFTMSISPEDCVRTVSEHCISSIELIYRQLHPPNSLNVVASLQTTPDDDLEPFDNITDHLSFVIALESEKFYKVVDLFHEYHQIFRARPGLNSLYICRFNTTEDVPFSRDVPSPSIPSTFLASSGS